MPIIPNAVAANARVEPGLATQQQFQDGDRLGAFWGVGQRHHHSGPPEARNPRLIVAANRQHADQAVHVGLLEPACRTDIGGSRIAAWATVLAQSSASMLLRRTDKRLVMVSWAPGHALLSSAEEQTFSSGFNLFAAILSSSIEIVSAS